MRISMGAFGDAVAAKSVVDERCAVAKVADTLDPDDADLYLDLLARPVEEIGHRWLRDRLKEAGVPVPSYTSFFRHRSQQCLCVGFVHTTPNHRRSTSGQAD